MKKALKEKFDKLKKEYVKEFCKKQNMEFESFENNFVKLSLGYLLYDDIRIDIDNEIKAGFIVDYYEYKKNESSPKMNSYKHYLKTFKRIAKWV